MRELTLEQQQQILEDLRYYGNEVAGNAPIGGYVSACKRAEKHWYAVTLPLLMELDAVYSDATKQVLSQSPITTTGREG